MRSMENVDICIELVRIREFDGSGGRIELFNALFPSFSNSFNIPFLSVVRAEGYSSAFVKFGDSSPPPTEGNLIPWTSVPSVVTTPLPSGRSGGGRRVHKKKDETSK